ncbi:MAG: Spy/CpxP family protein refolding chaperone [Verrucomicrobiales bacterium]|jgi:Spy/CpxP family protein refolding chaperone
MRIFRYLFIMSIVLGAVASAQHEDPFRDAFFPPDLVIHHAEELGISDADRQRFQDELQSRKEEFEKVGQAHRAASEAMAKTLEAHPVDATVVMEKLDALLSAENEMKRLHVSAMLAVRNQLTPDQIAKIDELKKRPNPLAKHAEFIKANIEPKKARFQQAMQAREAAQNPPPEGTQELIEKFHKLMKNGEVEYAVKAIDEALKLVE